MSHLGFVLLGIFAWNKLALQGAVITIICHGVSTGALFILVGALQERLHTRELARMSGLWETVPRLSGAGLFFALASMGLPGLGDFVGEFMILLGVYQKSRVLTAVAAIGILASTFYALKFVQYAFHGPNKHHWALPDLGVREAIICHPHDRYSPVAGTISAARVQYLQSGNGNAATTCRADHAGTAEIKMNRLTALSLTVIADCRNLHLSHAGNRHVAQALANLCMTLVGIAAAFGSLWLVAPLAPRRVTPLLILDHYALFYFGLITAATFAIAILCYGYLQRHTETREELYVLLLVAALGSMVLVASSHFVSFFLGLEILSVALYALSAYLHTRSRPLEAGIKYLILAGSSSAFLLFGMALIYAQLGTMDLFRLATLLPEAQNSPLVLGDWHSS